MSNKRTKAARKKQAGAKKQQEPKKPQGDQKPKVDPHRTNAKLIHVNNALNISLQNIQSLREETSSNVKQIWDNQEELKNGMGAAEYNLRAHQKVLNAIAIELDHLAGTYNDLVQLLNDTVLKEEVQKCGIGGELIMANIQLPPEKEGEEPKTVRRIDWPYYHKQVDKDLEILAELEAKAAEERRVRTAAIIKAVDKLRDQCTEESLKDLADRIEKGEQILKDENGVEFELEEATRAAVASRLRAGPLEKREKEEPLPPELEAQIEKMAEKAVEAGNDQGVVQEEARRLLRQSKRVAEELGKMQRGEPYDEEVIAEAQRMIEADEAENPAEPVEAKEDDDIPEGATVFGGG